MPKNPWLAAILNVLIIGLGYVYVGKRTVFGILLALSEVAALIWLFANPQYIKGEMLLHPLNIISALAFFFALAYDAYQDAQETI